MFRSVLIIAFSCILLFGCSRNLPDYGRSATERLTANAWQLDYITFAQDNTHYVYRRGGSGNTANFDYNKMKFNKDGTGMYTDGGPEFQITWEFVEQSDNSILEFTIYNYDRGNVSQGTNHNVRWENVVLGHKSLKYAELYVNPNNRAVISSATRTPVGGKTW
jgi:hypothetical protein